MKIENQFNVSNILKQKKQHPVCPCHGISAVTLFIYFVQQQWLYVGVSILNYKLILNCLFKRA